MAMCLEVAARTAAAVVALPVAPVTAQAQDWTGQVTLYGWGSGISRDFTPFTGAPALSFDMSLPEILKDLDGA